MSNLPWVGWALAFVPVAATGQYINWPAHAVIEHAAAGDVEARKVVTPIGWYLVKDAAGRGVDAANARQTAEVMLALASPLYAFPTSIDDSTRFWRSTAVNALIVASKSDQDAAWAIAQLDRMAPYPFLWDTPKNEIAVLTHVLARHHDSLGIAALTRTQLELEVGLTDSARAALDRVPANAASPAHRERVRAEVEFASGHDSVAAAAYYRGAATIADSADLDWYTRDLEWVAKPDEMAHWKVLDNSQREGWLRAFWNGRDVLDGRTIGTRLAEQFRRWRYALREFRWDYDGSTARGFVAGTAEATERNDNDVEFPQEAGSRFQYINRLFPLSRILDDRGGLVMRHGVPFKRLTLPAADQLSEETLEWLTPNGPLIVSFSRIKATEKTKSFSQRYGMLARNYPVGDLYANCALDTRLCLLAAEMGMGSDRYHRGQLAFAHTILTDFTAMRRTAESTDGNPEMFAKALPAAVEAYGIPDVGVLVVFSAAAKPLHAGTVGASAAMARLRIVVGDPEKGSYAASIDTTRQWRLPGPITDSTGVADFVVLPVDPGLWSVATVISDLTRSAGAGTRIGGVPVVDLKEDRLQLSDLILGNPAEPLFVEISGTRVPLNPPNSWQRNETATLTWQLGGLVVGRRYETSIEIREVGRKVSTSPKLTITFSENAGSARTLMQRNLALKDLTAGNYRVTLRVHDTVTGTDVTRDRLLAVRK